VLAALALSAAVAAGSFATDYRNAPDWRALVGFERVALSARAKVAADSLVGSGAEVFAWAQPLVPTWQGEPIRSWPWDAAMWETAERYGAVLPYAVEGDDISGARLLDFRVDGFPVALAQAQAAELDGWAGVLLDYGCPDLAWEQSLPMLGEVFWEPWREGYYLYRAALSFYLQGRPIICQCDTWQGLYFHCDGLVWEKVGWSLNPYEKVWHGLSSGAVGASVVLYPGGPGAGQRLAAGMALARDAAFLWRDVADPWTPQRDTEHFELTVGTFYLDAWERAPGVWIRVATHGLVLVNLSDAPYRYGSRVVGPMDALVIQFRNEVTGRWQKWRDNRP